MKRRHILPVLLVCLCCAAAPTRAQVIPLLGGQRAGISSLQFLKIGVGARAAALGEAAVAVVDDATALHYNPAGIANIAENQVHFSHTSWFVDLRHAFVGAVYRLSSADAVGVSFTSLSTDDMEITTETQPGGTGRYFSYGDMAVGLTYARALTQQFSFGATVRYVEETIDRLHTRAVLLDLGTAYHTGLGSTRFSVAVTNFGGNVSPEGTVTPQRGAPVSSFQEFSPPTLFRIGFAFEPYEDDTHRLTTSVQLNHPNDNSENVSLGLEYSWGKLFHLRGGYKINVDEEQFALGAGMSTSVGFARAAFDYAFTAHETLDAVHRLSLTLGF
ncbi:MAG: PorV/PorQ family protein [Ignavibacteriae bacterium]|nr:PorV/PorQ family protein [Ignavibacteriota bacterium]